MSSERLTIQVYISYRTTDVEQLEILNQAFSKYNDKADSTYYMQVFYSEKNIGEGDNIVEFMDKIAVAGIVVFLFSASYFNSPFCWYELIKSTEKGNMLSRSALLPIQFKDFDQEIDIAQLKKAINEWENNLAGKRELAELLKSTEEELIAKKRVVETAVLKPWFDVVFSAKNSDETVAEIERKVTTIFEEESIKFNAALLKNIKHALSRIPKAEISWEYHSGEKLSIEGIANKLIKMSYVEALIEIKEWAKEEYDRELSTWNSFFNKIQKLAGWFILKSIKQDWWLNHKLALTDGMSQQGFVSFFLKQEQLSYSEVIVSRGLLDIVEKPEPALFSLDDKHDLIPQGKQSLITEYNSFVIDSCDDAEIYTVLTPLFIDVKKIKPTEKDTKKLLAEFIRLVKADRERYFYLVQQSYLQQLKDCKSPVNPGVTLLAELKQSLKEKMVFIVIDAEQKPMNVKVSDDAEMALTYMQKILLIDKTYQTSP